MGSYRVVYGATSGGVVAWHVVVLVLVLIVCDGAGVGNNALLTPRDGVRCIVEEDNEVIGGRASAAARLIKTFCAGPCCCGDCMGMCLRGLYTPEYAGNNTSGTCPGWCAAGRVSTSG